MRNKISGNKFLLLFLLLLSTIFLCAGIYRNHPHSVLSSIGILLIAIPLISQELDEYRDNNIIAKYLATISNSRKHIITVQILGVSFMLAGGYFHEIFPT